MAAEIVFSLDLNIAKGAVKLPILSKDTLSDVICRLFEMCSVPN